MFWLLTILAYVRYVHRGGILNYVAVLLLFTGGLLSKPIAVAVPITLLLLDFWPLCRWHPAQGAAEQPGTTLRHSSPGAGVAPPQFRSLLLEKVPFFLLSALVGWVTVLAQADLGAIQSLERVPMGARLSNSIVACVLYLRKLVWPVDLAPIYPLRCDWPWWQVATAALVLLSIWLWVALQARKRPYLLFGWCWYAVTLLPTLGLVQVGLQGMADRYTYVPLIGIFLLMVWEISERTAGLRYSRIAQRTASAAVTGACILTTLATLHYWRATIPLFEHAVRVTRNNYIAHRFLGTEYKNNGDFSQAERHYRQSLMIEPNRAPTHRLLGAALFRKGDFQAALDQYLEALRLNPRDFLVHRELAEFFIRCADSRFRNPRKALEHARLACRLSRYRNRDAVMLLAEVCVENHESQQAAEAAQKALALSVGPREIQRVMQLLTNLPRIPAANSEQELSLPRNVR